MPNLSKELFFVVLASVSVLVCSAVSYSYASQIKGVHHPFPSQSNYPTTILLPNHLSRDELNERVRWSYEDWKKTYLIEVSDPDNSRKLYRISAGKNRRGKSLSEGQAYGMILTVYMAGYDADARNIFDGLWRFSRQHPSANDKSFMAYQVPISKSRRTSAFDGDCDMAYALILADKQWGSGGKIDYLREAESLIDALMGRVIGKKSRLPLLGDWVKQNGKTYNQYTVRSSDLLLTHFRLFHQVSGNSEWNDVVQSSQALIDQMQADYSPEAGLLPDFIVGTPGSAALRPAYASFLEGRYDGRYYYNAARVPWRLGADAILNGDQTSLDQVRKIARWALKISHGQPENIGPGYRLNGKRLRNEWYLSKAFLGPLGVAMMTLPESGQDFLNRTFDFCAEMKQDYFEDTIGLHCMLLMSGNYWVPYEVSKRI